MDRDSCNRVPTMKNPFPVTYETSVFIVHVRFCNRPQAAASSCPEFWFRSDSNKSLQEECARSHKNNKMKALLTAVLAFFGFLFILAPIDGQDCDSFVHSCVGTEAHGSVCVKYKPDALHRCIPDVVKLSDIVAQCQKIWPSTFHQEATKRNCKAWQVSRLAEGLLDVKCARFCGSK